MTMLFKICERGDNKPVLGLEDLPPDHAQVMMLVPVHADESKADMQVGEVMACREGRKGAKGNDKHDRVEYYDLVRTA